MEMQVKVYGAKPGAHINDEEAQIIGPELERITGNGQATARDIVERARVASSPLHKHFEWNDSVAAELHREDQARALARSIEVRVVALDGHVVESARAFVAVTNTVVGELKRYVPIEIEQAGPAMKEEVVQTARREFLSRHRKYEQYKELFAEKDPMLFAVMESIEGLKEDEEE